MYSKVTAESSMPIAIIRVAGHNSAIAMDGTFAFRVADLGLVDLVELLRGLAMEFQVVNR